MSRHYELAFARTGTDNCAVPYCPRWDTPRYQNAEHRGQYGTAQLSVPVLAKASS